MKKRKNGTGSYQQKGNRHIIQYFSAEGNRFTRSFPTELEARAALNNISKLESGQKGRIKLNLAQLFYKWNILREENATNYGYKVRFTKHWTPIIGHLRPEDVDVAILKGAIATFKKNGLSANSIGLLFRILSSFLNELLEDGAINANPVALLSKKTRKGFVSEKDPSKQPFIKKTSDISRIYTWLNGQDRSVSIGFALGVLAGLRLNEIRALKWEDIDFEAKLIHVRWQAGTEVLDGSDRLRPPKNKTGRAVPIADSLDTILRDWFERSLGLGFVVRPIYTPDPRKKFIGKSYMTDLLRRALKVLKVLKIGRLSWYAATRHTFASHWVMAGGSLVKLKEIMGHASFSTTERSYIHLVPGQYSEADRNVVKIELKDHEQPVDWRLKGRVAEKLSPDKLFPTNLFDT